MREAWETVRDDTSPYIATIEQLQEIAKQATNREGPFKTKNNNDREYGKQAPTEEREFNINKRRVVSEETASKFVRGEDLWTVNTENLFEADWSQV